MPTTLQAIYEADSGILKLERKLDIANYSKVKVIIELLPEPQSLARKLSGNIVIDEEIARHIVENESLLGDES